MPTTKNFYSLVPRDFGENLRYRFEIRKRAEGDEAFQRSMLTACKHDILFFLGAWSWLYEPRPRVLPDGRRLPKMLPFLPWSHQEPVIRQLREHLGYRDIFVEKSRGEGISWILVYLAVHDWLFDPGAKVGIVSRSEDEADDPNNSDSLMWKCDYAIAKLPNWMTGIKKLDWDRNLSKHSLTNFRNGSQINADAATGDIFRGGRLKWAAMDEFAFFKKGEDAEAMASSQGATNSRLFVSTVKGRNNEFYKLAVEPRSSLVRIVVDWKDNPSKNRGLYRMVKNVPVAIDPVGNPLPPHYDPPSEATKNLFSQLRSRGFNLEARLRSPWYDVECDRGVPHLIAQELDRDYGGSQHHVFGHDFMVKAESKVRPPLIRGNIIHHPETLEPQFDRAGDGPMLVWCNLDRNNRPPASQYAIGIDVSSGLGGAWTSNSSIEVIDLVKMEQVFEFASNTVSPNQLADLAIAIAKWFFDAYLAWERNGPGNAFTKRILQQKYGNVYYRKHHWVRGEKKTKELGWWTSDDTKEAMFDEILLAVLGEKVTIHSELLAKEFHQYVRLNGKIEHELAISTDDDSAKGKAHGDRVIGFGVCLMAAKDRPSVTKSAVEYEEYLGEPPPGSMAARKRELDANREKNDDVWDDRENADLAAGGRGFGNRLGNFPRDLVGW